MEEQTKNDLIEIENHGRNSYKVRIGDHEIVMADSVGAAAAAPTPVQYFAAAFGACHALVAEGFLRKHGLAEDGVTVSVGYATAASPKRVSDFILNIKLPVTLSPEMQTRLEKNLEYCTIRSTIVNEPALSIRIQMPDTDAAAADALPIDYPQTDPALN